MFDPLIDTTLLIVAGIVLVRFWPRIYARLKRIDDANIARIRQEREDRRDRFAHFRHTLDVASEQVDEIREYKTRDERTGTPVTRYLFDGDTFASRDEAERTRAEKVGDIARGFYRDLPRALVERREDGKLR
jgi:hypothetical protein